MGDNLTALTHSSLMSTLSEIITHNFTLTLQLTKSIKASDSKICWFANRV